MRAFLMTSSPCELGVPGMLEKNGQVELLKRLFPEPFSMLYVCSDPASHEKTDLYGSQMKATFEEKGFFIPRFTTLDDRNAELAAGLVRSHDMVFLAGGHVPTQNRFFQAIGLRTLLQDYDGVVMSLSAGSMNAAWDVYASPEEPGEAIDPAYRRDLEGLGLTEINIEPHFQLTKNWFYDGLQLVRDILIPDSAGRDIYCFPDGTYLLNENGREVIYGACDRIRRGEMTRICEDGACYPVPEQDEPFPFLPAEDLTDGIIRLQLDHTSEANRRNRWVPAYHFRIHLMDGTEVGTCDLRIGYSARLYIGGQIGYQVYPPFRSHHYAARAVCLLRAFAARHGMTYLYITCAVDNIASRRTCEAAGGQLIEVADVPKDHDLFIEEGQKQVCVYRFDTAINDRYRKEENNDA